MVDDAIDIIAMCSYVLFCFRAIASQHSAISVVLASQLIVICAVLSCNLCTVIVNTASVSTSKIQILMFRM